MNAIITLFPLIGLATSHILAMESDITLSVLKDIVVDADLNDWNQPHFQECLSLDQNGYLVTKGDGGAVLHLGWKDGSILVALEVTDNHLMEEEKIDELWRKDSVELFVSPVPGEAPIHLLVSPGLTEQFPQMRLHAINWENGEILDIDRDDFRFRRSGTGYVFEGKINLEVVGAEATNQLGIQVYVNDADPGEGRQKLVWFPYFGAHSDFEKLYSVELSNRVVDRRPENIRLYATIDSYGLTSIRIRLVAPGGLNGSPVRFGKGLTRDELGILRAYGPYSALDLELPVPQDLVFGTPSGAWLEIEGAPLPLEIDYWSQMPLIEEIRAFALEDLPHTGGILFYGSSSIRLWESLLEDFAGLPVLNRGFGGSTAPQALIYSSVVLPPHQPKVVVLYEGDNDMVQASVEQFTASYKKLMQRIRDLVPGIQIVMLPIKPSPGRIAHISKIHSANQWMRNQANPEDGIYFVDTISGMLDAEGRIRPELFVEDNIHMNADGYRIWVAKLRPLLEKLMSNMEPIRHRRD